MNGPSSDDGSSQSISNGTTSTDRVSNESSKSYGIMELETQSPSNHTQNNSLAVQVTETEAGEHTGDQTGDQTGDHAGDQTGDHIRDHHRSATQDYPELSQGQILSVEADSEDEYISSGDDVMGALDISDHQYRHLTYGSGLAEHVSYLEKSLGDTLDSVALDTSLAMQAQLSGQLNDKSKILVEKQAQILAQMNALKVLHKKYISHNELGVLEKDIDDLTLRIRRLKHGHSKSTLFGRKTSPGIIEKYPIEYNQAKDKVMERSSSS